MAFECKQLLSPSIGEETEACKDGCFSELPEQKEEQDKRIVKSKT